MEDRVRALVEQFGGKQEAFAEAVGLDPTKFSKSLNKKRRFTSLELARIADFSRVTVDWLLQGDEGQTALAARVGTDGASVEAAISRAVRLAEARDNLEFLDIHLERPESPEPKGALWVEQGKHLAEFALEHLGVPSVLGPSETFASAIERAFGIDVCLADLGEGCDGLAYCTATSRILLVATSGNPTRQRFTMAHELAHLLGRDSQQIHVDENVMAKTGQREASEMRANSFAATLLMPETLISERLHAVTVTEHRFAELAMELMVSPSSLAWRLLNLKVISDEERRTFGALRSVDCASITDSMKEYASWVEASSQERIPIRLLQDTLQAYVEGKATLQPAANLIEVPVDALRRAIEPGDTLDESANLEFSP